MSKLISLGTGREKCYLYFAWICCFLVGATLPAFIFLIGPVFDAFGPDQSKEDSLENVGYLVGVMAGLATIVFIASFGMHHYQTKGSFLIVRRIKTAYLDAVLKQEASWFDMSNYTALAADV